MTGSDDDLPADDEATAGDGFPSDAELQAGPSAAGALDGDADLEGFRSGFVSLVGRPNVGKSTLLNRILDHKVTIVSDKPQTTRYQVRGVLDRDDVQIVFVDTPGLHKPRSQMGERLNSSALGASGEADVVCVLLDASAKIGPGDRWVMERAPSDAIVVLNKCDKVGKDRILEQLAAASEFGAAEYFPVSATTGEGVDALVAHLQSLMPPGPRWFPEGLLTDIDEAQWLAELVREQLLAVTRDELPHSIACRTVAWNWPHLKVEILVERESQKGMVIGKGGSVLKRVGTNVRRQLAEGAYLELVVRVEKNWQRTDAALDQLGY